VCQSARRRRPGLWGGPEGGAALAAAREGARTLLVERMDSSAGLLIRGAPDLRISRGACFVPGHRNCHGHGTGRGLAARGGPGRVDAAMYRSRSRGPVRKAWSC